MKKQAEARIPSDIGTFDLIAYSDSFTDQMPHLVVKHPDVNLDDTVLVRIHSECMTGDLFHSRKCDCGEQLNAALDQIMNQKGLLIYLRQEGRGIGIINKLKAYNLQDKGLNTIDANVHLGFEADERDYKLATDILEDLGIKQISLLTNNPEKISAIEHSKIKLVKTINLQIAPKKENKDYLSTKKSLMGHFLDL